MGEDVYTVNDIDIRFSEADEEYSCLCTFPANGIDLEVVRSLALLGTATVLACREDEEDLWFLPHCVPQEIRDGIDEILYNPLDDLSRIADIVRKIHTPYSLDANRKKQILKLLRRWGSSRTEEKR